MEQVGGALGDGLGPGLFFHQCEDHRVDGARGFAVFAEGDILGGLANHFPAAELDVHHCLGADDLGGGGNEWDPAERFSNDGDFADHFIELIGHALFCELVAEVREHAAGDLEDEDVGIDAFVRRTGEFGELFVNFLEVEAEFLEFRGIIIRAARVAFQQGEHADGVRLAGAVGKGSDRGFDRIHAGIDGGEVSGGT